MNTVKNATSFLISFTKPHPSRDWLLLLAVFSAGFVFCIGIAGFLFLGIRSGTIVGRAEGNTPSAPSVTRGELKEVLGTYQKKETNFNARNYPTPALSDPSR